MAPVVTVIIPCYNVEDLLESCVASARASARCEIEIVCIDDGSTDDTLGVLTRLAESGKPHIRVLRQTNLGAAAARNAGLAVANGEFVQFLDADDLLRPDKISHQLERLDPSSADFLAGAYECQTMDLEHRQWKHPRSGDPLLSLMTTDLGITSSNLWRRSALDRVGGWDPMLRSSQEADLMFRLLTSGSEVLIDDAALTIVRQGRAGSISADTAPNLLRYAELRCRIVEHVRSDPATRESEVAAYFDVLHDVLQTLAATDLDSAATMYARTIPRKYRPLPSRPHRRRSYLMLLRTLGFERTQRVRLGAKALLYA